MAFKPIVKEKEIQGEIFKAQFNGFSALLDARAETEGNERKMAEYIFKNVITEPAIDDVDEFFGTNSELFAEVLAFGSAVMAADEEYFPKTDKEGTKGASKK